MSTKVQACNLAASRLGSYGSVEDIDQPRKPLEIIFAKWWDHARRMALESIMPNFAITRRVLAPDSTAPAFGYTKRFQVPSDSVRVLGVGQQEDKANDYSIEGGYILTDQYVEDADGNVTLNLRFVIDEADVSKYTPDFMEGLSWFLAYCANMEVTHDADKQVYLERVIRDKKAEASSLNSQQNRPIRLNNSKFRQARSAHAPTNYEKL